MQQVLQPLPVERVDQGEDEEGRQRRQVQAHCGDAPVDGKQVDIGAPVEQGRVADQKGWGGSHGGPQAAGVSA